MEILSQVALTVEWPVIVSLLGLVVIGCVEGYSVMTGRRPFVEFERPHSRPRLEGIEDFVVAERMLLGTARGI